MTSPNAISPIKPPGTAISSDSFQFLQKLIYQNSGIVIDETKNYLLESRLQPIVKEQKLPSINDLCNLLRGTASQNVRKRVIECMTTNETLFFRDPIVFQALQAEVFPEILRRNAAERSIRIWSAAASTGQEAYSLIMALLESGFEGWSIEVVGTDLAESVLDRARAGKYLQIEVNRGLPARMLVKYFTRSGMDWIISEKIRRHATFRQFDLRQSYAALGRFDLVLCRNVLIYFDMETKKTILRSIRSVMKPESLLVLGTAETTLNIDESFSRRQYGQAVFYQPS